MGQRPGLRLGISLHGCFAIAITLAALMLLYKDALPPQRWEAATQRTLWERRVSKNCNGRRVYIHNISEAYNRAFVRNCGTFKKDRNLCMYMENEGLGRGFTFGAAGAEVAAAAWYNTWQFSLELYFHERLLRHPCTTAHEHLADALYVPYYAGMDLSHTCTHQLAKEKLFIELAAWLQERESWKRRGGRDHFITLGRIAQDFHIRGGGWKSWGNGMLLQEPFKQMVRLTIERTATEWDNMSESADNEIAIPYPTYFHASSDAEIQNLVHWVCQTSQRKALVSMAAGKRRGAKSFRHRLMTQCGDDPRCTLLLCQGHESSPSLADEIANAPLRPTLAGKTHSISCNNPVILLGALHQSQFCLQPPGDSPTRRSFFDAMLAGCIPVIFSKHAAWSQYLHHLPENGSSYSVSIPSQASTRNVVDILSEIGTSQIDEMRANIAKLLPHVLYAHIDRKYAPPPDAQASGGTFLATPDAFDIALDAVFGKIHSNYAVVQGKGPSCLQVSDTYLKKLM